jgi:hypothetical protein
MNAAIQPEQLEPITSENERISETAHCRFCTAIPTHGGFILIKVWRFLPGTHIPIRAPERIREYRPDQMLILTWNLKAEFVAQLDYAREWGAKFIAPILTA